MHLYFPKKVYLTEKVYFDCLKEKKEIDEKKIKMSEADKKISFGFSKSIKKPVLKNTPIPEVKKVDYIECLDEKSVKVIG